MAEKKKSPAKNPARKTAPKKTAAPKPKIAFVSGATGHLGAEIVRQLVQDEHMHVRVMARQSTDLSPLAGLDVEVVHVGLDDEEGLAKALKGAHWVFHVAAHLGFWRNDWPISYRVNVLGTRHMVQAALKAGVKKFVYTSSGSTIGRRDDGEPHDVDETNAYNLADYGMVYPHTKYLGELEVHEGVQRGLDAVITHPTSILGPGDVKLHFKPIFDGTKKGLFLAVPDGIRNTCDVRDVARGHLLAAKKGKKGEQYILGGESFTNKDFIGAIAKEVGGPPPLVTLPRQVVRFAGKIGDALGDLTGEEPKVNSESATQATFHVMSSSEKARRELGYTCRPFTESLRDTVAWYRREGLL